MSRELEPIKALEYLDDIAHGRIMKYDAHDLKLLVEKELKEYEELKKEFETEHILRIRLENMLYELRIIKEKDVSMLWLRHSKTVEDYNISMLGYQKLTQAEFDLLKKYSWRSDYGKIN